MFRQLCCTFCSTTKETILQKEGGQSLQLIGTSPGGMWDRTLISSGIDNTSNDDDDDDGTTDRGQYEVVYAKFLDPDKESVTVEAWWDEMGTVHHSFMRGKASVCGGEFESRRYLDYVVDDKDATKHVIQLVCESTFHPFIPSPPPPPTTLDQRPISITSNTKFRPAFIQWRYTMV
jgi:hypothetical protein